MIFYLPLWPNFVGSEDAPATAKREDEKNVFSAASICFWLGRKKMEFTSWKFFPMIVGMRGT